MSNPIHPFELVAKAIGCNPDNLSEDSAMYRDFGWDSLGHMHVIQSIEGEYDIEIDDENVENLKTMREILKIYDRIISSR